MKIIAGLGNPGARYETTRHNAGFLALDRLIEQYGARGPAEKYQGEIYEGTIAGERAIFVKPQTFMNLSGRCVGPLFSFYKCAPEDLIVIYDEIDLPPLTMRIKQGGGSGGHNGIKSLDQSLGADHNEYLRVRIGIGHPRTLNLKMDPADYVLQQFSDEELSGLDALFDDLTKAVELLVGGKVNDAMTKFNQVKG
ncbi:aminoacyl-tRNA hydrolase [bacterium]|jgi:PTH1 family peptidyl-tRNA hydrolase|nr:aminoacyl-tRNA hydrolase [bacterium]